MNSEPAMVKGLVFVGALKHIRETYGEDIYQRYLGALPPEIRRRAEAGSILPITQLPAEYYQSLLAAFIKVFGETSGVTNFQKAATAVAFKDLGTVMKFFMKIGSPSITAAKFPSSYARYFTHGRVLITEQSSNSIHLVLEDAQAYGRAGCLACLFWMREALVYSGAKNLVAEHDSCRFKKQLQCSFAFTWQ